MPEHSAAEILMGFDKAKSDRTIVENTWEDLFYYGAPRKRGVQSQYEPGEKLPDDVYDDTAIQSNLILAAGLSGYMTNAAQRWFELRTRDERLMRSSGAAKFFQDSAEAMYAVLGNSNFYQQVHEVYLDLGVAGNGPIYEDEDIDDVVRFYSRHPKEVYVVEDDRDNITMLYRKFQFTAWQAYKKWGDAKVGKAVMEAIANKDFNKKFDFVHYVCPRNKRDPRKKDGTNKPFASYWVSCADKKMVHEGGYEEFPYMYPRFYKNSGETYGYGPMYSCYPSVQRLNNATMFYEDSAKFDAYPPWLAEHDGLMGTLDLRKDAMNYQRQPLSQGQAVQSLKHDRNIQIGLDYMQRQEQKIQKAFFVDLFLMLAQGVDMTATEVVERTQEKMLILGPVLGRLQNELLNPIIYRTFNIMMRAGKLPQIPEELNGVEWDVVYVSPLAKAQRAVQARDMQTFIAIIGQMAQMAPTVLDKVNADKVVDKFAKAYSVDPDVINDDDEVNAVRQDRSQQQMAMQKMATMQQGAMIAKDAGAASASFAKAKEKPDGQS
jgi:hypothetical protein